MYFVDNKQAAATPLSTTSDKKSPDTDSSSRLEFQAVFILYPTEIGKTRYLDTTVDILKAPI